MKQSGHLNPSEETGTGCPLTSKYGRTPPDKHGGVSRQQHGGLNEIGLCDFRELCPVSFLVVGESPSVLL